MTVRTWALLAIALILAPNDILASKVKATFTDTKNKPIEKVECKLVADEGGKEWMEKSNKKGEVDFDNLPDGSYVLWAREKDFLPYKSEKVQASGRETSLKVTLITEEQYREMESAGNNAMQQGKYAEAVKRYEEILGYMPHTAIIWSNLAKASVGTGDREKSIEAARRAASLEPEQFGGLENQIDGFLSLEEGRIALNAQDYPKAVEALTKALSVDASNPDAFYALALAYGHQKKYDDALKNIEQAIKLRPNDEGFLELQRVLKHNAQVSGK